MKSLFSFWKNWAESGWRHMERMGDMLDLSGQAVKHTVFGKGVITEQKGSTITIVFPEGEKKFLFPDSFRNHLSLKNEEAAEQVDQLMEQREEHRHARTQALLEEKEQAQRVRNFKITANSQAAFALELEVQDVFSDWTVDTGTYLSGGAKGQPRIPDRLKPNSACLLTRCPAGAGEEERQIVGAFMVPEGFFGEDCGEGQFRAHADHRLAFPVGKSLPYWSYLEETKQKPRWGKTAFKYLGNPVMQRILYDCQELLAQTEQADAARRFYQYFNKMNRMVPLLRRQWA